MTNRQRKPTPETETMRFLLEEFIDIAEEDEPEAGAVVALKERAARVLLPGSRKGAFWPMQSMFVGLSEDQFQRLRRDVRDWLGMVARSTPGGQPRTLKGRLTLSLVRVQDTPGRFRAPLVEGDALDVFWFYLFQLLARVGSGQIGVCHAPRAGTTEPCGRLFLKRGKAKRHCSELCRVRLAARKSRKK